MTDSKRPIEADAKKFEAEAQKSFFKGCIMVFLVGLGLLVGVVIFGSKIAREWAEAKPNGMSDSAWSQKQEMCKRINLGASECAARSDNAIKTLSDIALKHELEKICSDDNPSAAIVEAQRIARSALKAPASANFVGSSTRTAQDGCIWTVSGEVDAQNSFGAELRSNYQVKLRRTGKDLWFPMKVHVR